MDGHSPLEGVARAQSPYRGWSSPFPPPTLESASPPGDGLTVKRQRALSDEQERLRIEGLRALARMIARRALASPRLPAELAPGRQRQGKQPDGVRRDRSA